MNEVHSEIKSWIDLAKCGARFHEHAARQMLSCIRLKRNLVVNGSLVYVLASCFGRNDWKGAFQFAIDWSDPYSLPTADISRFQPGEHYHVLDTKFDTWIEALNYLEKNGYRRGQSHTVYVPREGD